MKRKKTIIKPDGTKEIFEEHDEAPQMHSAKAKEHMSIEKAKQMGHKGDTQLAHINNYEAALLKKMGGSGTTNPHTGLKQYYIDPATGLENGLPADQPVGYSAALSQPATAQTPGNFDVPLNIAPYSSSQSVSGGTNQSNSLGLNQATNQSEQGSFSLGTNQAQNTSNSGATNQATNQAQNTAFNEAQNTSQNQAQNTNLSTAQNTAQNQAQNTNLSQAQNTAQNQAQNTNVAESQNTNLSQAQNTAQNQGFTVGNTGSVNTGAQGSENMAESNSFTNAFNYSGLDEGSRTQLMGAIMPQLQTVAQNMPEQYDIYTQEALSSYQNMLQNALQKQIPQTIKQLADRGIISSADGVKMLSQVMSDAAISASDKGYQTAMASALAKATNVPDMLAKIAQLGQYTQGGSTGVSSGLSTGSSFGNTLGTSYGTNLGVNTGSAQGTSLGVGQGTSSAMGQGTSSGVSQGTSLGVGQGTSSGTSQGTSLGYGQGTSSGVSQGTSIGGSQGTSSGQSTGQSFANAQGTSAGQNQAGSFGTSAGQSTGINASNATGQNFATSQSFQTDPTVMYRQMADLIQRMIPQGG